MKERGLEVVVLTTNVSRSDNPTARGKTLSFFIGPLRNGGGIEQATEAWAAAQKAVVAVTLSQIQTMVTACPDVAEVYIGLAQSDFIREFGITREARDNKDPVVIERVCIDGDGAPLRWNERYCL